MYMRMAGSPCCAAISPHGHAAMSRLAAVHTCLPWLAVQPSAACCAPPTDCLTLSRWCGCRRQCGPQCSPSLRQRCRGWRGAPWCRAAPPWSSARPAGGRQGQSTCRQLTDLAGRGAHCRETWGSASMALCQSCRAPCMQEIEVSGELGGGCGGGERDEHPWSSAKPAEPDWGCSCACRAVRREVCTG